LTRPWLPDAMEGECGLNKYVY